MKEQQIRNVTKAIIRRVCMEVAGGGESLNKALDAAYPFGDRSGPLYEIWCEEARMYRETHGRAA